MGAGDGRYAPKKPVGARLDGHCRQPNEKQSMPPLVPFSALAGCLCYGLDLSLFFTLFSAHHMCNSKPTTSAPLPTSPDCDWCSVLAVLADGDGCMLRMSKAHRVER